MFTFGQLSFFLSSQLLGPKTLPNVCTQICAKTDTTTEAYGNTSTVSMGWCWLPLWLPRSLPGLVQTVKLSLISGVVILFLYFSRVQLLPLGLSLECLGEDKASILLHLTNISCPVHGPICLHLSMTLFMLVWSSQLQWPSFHRRKHFMSIFQDPQAQSMARGHCWLQKEPGLQWGIRWGQPTKSKCRVLSGSCY